MATIPVLSLVLVVAVALRAAQAQIPTLPQLDPEEWWGPEELKGKTNTDITKFNVTFDQNMIYDLLYRLNNYRKPTQSVEGANFEYGFNSHQLEPWVNYWAKEYDFAEREKYFNKFPQYKTNIQGLDIHFIRVKPDVSPDVEVLPLLCLHGWPYSVVEFYGTIPEFTSKQQGYDFVFEVIIPSLPGFGFSDGGVRPGLGGAQMAVILKNLMTRLGFDKFYLQGGDWGAIIAKAMVTLYPEAVLGYHANWLTVLNTDYEIKSLTESIKATLDNKRTPESGFIEEFGYFHMQATKPDTLGVGLSDSAAGLMAYFLEKISTFSRFDNRFLPDGGLFNIFTKEQLIDNIMMYWITNTITPSMRLYSEYTTTGFRKLRIDTFPTTVPTWNLQARYEPLVHSLSKTVYPNLLGVTRLEEGAHFLALELPKPLAADVFKAVKAFIEFHDQKKTKTEL